MQQTARSKDHMISTTLRRGFDDMCTAIKRDEDVLPPQDLAESYRMRVEECREVRNEIWKILHPSNPPKKANFKNRWKNKAHTHPKAALVQLWIDMGDKIAELGLSLKSINQKFHDGKPEMEFAKIFMGVTRNLVNKTTYDRIILEAERLKANGFKGTNEEWAEFVETLK